MAEPDWQAIVGLIFFVVVGIPILLLVITAITPSKCVDENNKIADLTGQINIQNTKISELNTTATFYQEQYNNLTTTTITKKDFTDM